MRCIEISIPLLLHLTFLNHWILELEGIWIIINSIFLTPYRTLTYGIPNILSIAPLLHFSDNQEFPNKSIPCRITVALWMLFPLLNWNLSSYSFPSPFALALHSRSKWNWYNMIIIIIIAIIKIINTSFSFCKQLNFWRNKLL